MKRVLVDASGLRPVMDGLGQYVAGLLHGFMALGATTEWHMGVLVQPDALERHASLFRRWKDSGGHLLVGTVAPIGPRRDLAFWQLTRTIQGFDVFHCTSNQWPRSVHRGVITIHDLIYYDYPDSLGRFGRIKRAWIHSAVRSAVYADTVIMVPSEVTMQRLQATFPRLDPSRVIVSPLGAEHVHWEEGERDIPDAVRRRHERYIFALGSSRAHKNLGGLVREFLEMKASLSAEVGDVSLIVAGNDAWLDGSLREVARVRKDIAFLGYVDEKTKYALLRNALVSVVPSLSEGFGLAVVESFAVGTPVLASRRGSLPEVGGSAAAYFNPLKRGDLANRLGQLLRDDVLRRDLGRQGLARSQKYMWTRTAELTLAAYKRMA